MTTKKSGLGRNLSALLGNSDLNLNKKEIKAENTYLSTESLQPGKYQPRTDFCEKSLEELSVSIKNQGILQPLIVREIGNGKYEIIAGERRWRASTLAGLSEVPVVIHKVDNETAMTMALIENLQREDLNSIDKARAMHRLFTEFALTHQKIAEILAISRTAVTNHLRLLNLENNVLFMLESGDLEMGHARCLLMLEQDKQLNVAKLITAKQLSVRETEALINKIKTNKKPREKATPLFSSEIENLAKILKTKINLKPTKSGKGTIMVHYDNHKKLEEIISALTATNSHPDDY